MPAQKGQRPAIVWVLILLLLFLSLNALAAGTLFVLAPDGHLLGMPVSTLSRSPFPDFLLPGILLLVLNGLFPLAVAYSLWRQPAWSWPDLINPFKQFHWSWAASLAIGAILITWILFQLLWIEFFFLQPVLLAWGALIVLITLLPPVRQYCARTH